MKIEPDEINDNFLKKENLIEYLVIMLFWISCENLLEIISNKFYPNKIIFNIMVFISALIILIFKYHFKILL